MTTRMHVSPSSHLELWLAASVASAWPVLRANGDSERIEAILASVENRLGPLPQAIIDEPWEDGDPWLLEVALPGLAVEVAVELSAIDGVWFSPGPRPELAQALERGTRLDELERVDPVVARRPIGTEGAELPELGRSNAADSQVQALEAEITERLRAVDPSLQSWSSRGPDTVAPVVDPETGRFGVLISLASEAFAPLDGETLLARRRAILEALNQLVIDRAEHLTFKLRSRPGVVDAAGRDGRRIVGSGSSADRVGAGSFGRACPRGRPSALSWRSRESRCGWSWFRPRGSTRWSRPGGQAADVAGLVTHMRGDVETLEQLVLEPLDPVHARGKAGGDPGQVIRDQVGPVPVAADPQERKRAGFRPHEGQRPGLRPAQGVGELSMFGGQGDVVQDHGKIP